MESTHDGDVDLTEPEEGEDDEFRHGQSHDHLRSNGHSNGQTNGDMTTLGLTQEDGKETPTVKRTNSHEVVVWEVIRARAELGRMKADGMAALHAQDVSSAVQRIETERLQQRSEKALAMHCDHDAEERDERLEKSRAMLAEKEAAAKVLAVRFSRTQQVSANQVCALISRS